MIIVSNTITNFLKINGIALFPFIILNVETSKKPSKINHEKIHIRQEIELLVFIFYIWYIIEFVLRTFKYFGQIEKAYLNISFEREAYSNENNLEYLRTKKWYSFLKYLTNQTK